MSQQTADIESKNLPTHVALCAERYRGMNHRLGSIERKLNWGGSVLIVSLITIAVRLWVSP